MISKLIDFVVLNEDGIEPLLNNGLPELKPRPDTKFISELEHLIATGANLEITTLFAELVSLGEQWDWAERYYDYLVELNKVEQYNANLPDPIPTEEGALIEAEPKAMPTEPLRPAVRTVDNVLEPYQKQIMKIQGIEFKGIDVSLNESNQNGLSALKSALEIAKEFEVDDEFFPINFNAETCDGTQVLTLVDEAEFKEFGLQFIMARKAFFE
ncbi:hypothetical protein [Pseudoalteromonas shioyasakiensis]|uniref:hypothetical protein n=1 Tax=Pseudoalteromonas shioyasakiensis TaxID=1190813 RepID=UPI000781A345|nr:hypothetical protein [Pseudoalteromonas shioyasakiensis]